MNIKSRSTSNIIADNDAKLYPVGVSFYVSMALKAAQRGSSFGGSWRLWVLAQSISNSGMVFPERLKEHAVRLGVKPRTYRNWMLEATCNGVFEEITITNSKGIMRDKKQKGRIKLRVIGTARLASLMGISSLQNRVDMKASGLIGKGWKARVHSGLYASEAIMSREFVQKNYNIIAKTQQRRDKQAGVKATKNYVLLHLPDNATDVVKANTHHKCVFAYNDNIAIRKPDSKTSPHCDKSRTAKRFLGTRFFINSSGAFYSTKMEESIVRLFCSNEKQLRKSIEIIDRDNLDVLEVFSFLGESNGIRFHEAELMPQ